MAANLLRFRFIDVFILVLGFPFRVMFVVRHLFPEIRDEVPENFSERLKFFNPPSPRLPSSRKAPAGQDGEAGHGLPGLNGFGTGTH